MKASRCPRPLLILSPRGLKPLVAGLGCLAAAVVLCCEPAKVDSGSFAFRMSSAAAKEGNNGNGRGGNSGNNGKGSGNSAGQGNSKGSDKAGGSQGKSSGPSSNSSQQGRSSASSAGSSSSNKAGAPGSRMGVTHRNGFREAVVGGRYRMLDNMGRTIIDRPAVQADLLRLRQLVQ